MPQPVADDGYLLRRAVTVVVRTDPSPVLHPEIEGGGEAAADGLDSALVGPAGCVHQPLNGFETDRDRDGISRQLALERPQASQRDGGFAIAGRSDRLNAENVVEPRDGIGLSVRALTTDKNAVCAAMPSARVSTAAMVNPGSRTSRRSA